MPKFDIADCRKRIESIEDEAVQIACKDLYLKCGRAAETVSNTYPGRTVYGPTGKDAIKSSYEDSEGKEWDVILFTVKTAKRHGLERICALPLDKNIEPWAEQVYEYYKKKGDKPVFPFTRQYLWREAKPYFEGLDYTIYDYSIFKDGIKLCTVGKHEHPCALHWIRHLRATELMTAAGYNKKFRFDWNEVMYFGGWTVSGLIGGAASSIGRYIEEIVWENYFPKLLRVKR